MSIKRDPNKWDALDDFFTELDYLVQNGLIERMPENDDDVVLPGDDGPTLPPHRLTGPPDSR